MIRDLRFSTNLKLTGLPPYDFSLTVHKPAGWSFLTPFEVYEKGTLWTAMRWNSTEILGLKLSSTGTTEKPVISCEVSSSRKLTPERKGELSETLKWMLSLNEDVSEFYRLARSDSFIRTLTKDLYGMRRTKRPDIFPMLMLAVTLQMAPISRSNQMMNLLIKEYGVKIELDDKEIAYWPSPEVVAKASVAELRQKCKLGYRARVLKGIAQEVTRGFPTMRELDTMTPEEAKAKLMELKGIGDYSADIVSPHPGFALDVWSAKIFNLLLFGKQPESPRDIIPKLKSMAEERWSKWKGYVFVYMLNDLKNLSKRHGIDLTEI